MQEFIEQIVQQIIVGTVALDPARQHLFLVWLGDHTSQVRCKDEVDFRNCLMEKLKVWLNILSPAGILWEYHLILTELEWWQHQEEEFAQHLPGGER